MTAGFVIFRAYNFFMKKILFLFMLMTLLASLGFAQEKLIINSEGMPPFTTYSGTDYNGHNQVWDVIQDERGLIYIATTYGLHEFDGEDWRRIEIGEGAVPRSFSKGENGRIYLGGNDIMGYLYIGHLGLTSFQTLDDKLPVDVTAGRIGFVSALEGKAFFSGAKAIMVYDEQLDEIQYFNTGKKSYPSFVLDGKVYFKVDGLLTYANDTLVAVKHGDYFSGKAIYDFMAYAEDSVIALSATHEYHYFDKDTAFQKKYATHSFFKDKVPYRILKLTKDYHAICYLNAGLVITDKYWNPVLHIDESTKINQEVFNAFLDAQNNLWLATNFGVTVLEMGSKHSNLDLTTGLSGDVTGFIEEDEKLYVATTTGLFYKTWTGAQEAVQRRNHTFEKVKNSDVYNDGFLANSSPPLVRAYGSIGQVIDGVYQKIVDKGSGIQAQSIYLMDSSYSLSLGKDGSSLQIFQNDGQKWRRIKRLENDALPKTIYNLKYDHTNDLIWGANITQLFSFTLSKDLSKVENFNLYSEADGLPFPTYNFVLTSGQNLLVSTKAGIYQFDVSKSRFEKSNILGNSFEAGGLGEIFCENDSIFWYFTNDSKKGQLKFTSNSWTMDSKIGKLLPSHSRSIYYSPGKGMLYGGSNVISFLQEGKNEDYTFGFKPLVRQLDVISGQDSSIFYGGYMDADSSFGYVQKNPILLEYEQNDIRLSYAIPYYRHPEKVQYQFRLEGFEEEWSEWTNKTQKEYTNLWAGDYTFNVRARNGFMTQSKEGQIEFKVLPPWQQTWWAYGLYGLLFIGFIRFILVLNSKRLKAENEKLEETIAEGVKEIKEQKNVIAQSLLEKESLLKEIHHRVKNNLQIIASLLYLQSGKFEDEDFKRVLEEGQGRVRSMALIHQKLYENDDLKSIPFDEYLMELVSEIRASFGMGDVALQIKAENTFFDVDTAVPLGLIINELATNAFKYAYGDHSRGSFSITLTKEGDYYSLNVRDNGQGLPDEIDIKKTKSLGLRLVRMLSQQLEGEFEFERENGTSFNLKFVA